MEIKDRIDQVRIAKGLKVQQFEIMCQYANGSWAKSNNIREETLLKFINCFPEVNPIWLLTGDGNMFKLDKTLRENDKNARMEEIINLCKSLIDNFQQRDEVMAQLVSMVNQID